MNDPLSNKREIAQLLTFYIRPGFEAATGQWTSDNYAEMDHLADLFIKEIEWKISQHADAGGKRTHNWTEILARVDAKVNAPEAQG